MDTNDQDSEDQFCECESFADCTPNEQLLSYIDSEIGFHYGFMSGLPNTVENYDAFCIARSGGINVLNNLRKEFFDESNYIYAKQHPEDDDDTNGNGEPDNDIPPAPPSHGRDVKDVIRLDTGYTIPEGFKLVKA